MSRARERCLVQIFRQRCHAGLLFHREREGGREGQKDSGTEGERERGGQKECICLT
jgi:hypothetical protein